MKKYLNYILLIIICINFISKVYAVDTTIDFETIGGYTVTTTVTGTNTDWTRTTNTPYEGLYSIESATGLNDNDVGCFEITNNVAETARVLSFFYKVSSEAGYDYLRFYLDGIQQDQWAGSIGRTKQSYNLPVGNHTFRWCYEKDGTVSNGTDQAWVDLVDVSIDPNQISSGVFHYDGFDIDGDGDTTNNPSEGTTITTWVDTFNAYNATQTSGPTYNSNAIVSHSGSVFGTTNYLDIANQTAINTSTYTEKSFAIVLKTGSDINTLQTVYEQGGGVRGYSIQIENGILYSGVWNNNERIVPDQYKTLSTNISANTEYRIIMVQNSTDATLTNNTFEVFINGSSIGSLNNVDYQRSHAGGVQLGRSNGSIQLSNDASLGTGFNFLGNIGEFYSWNYALTNSEAISVDSYLYDKWIYTPPIPGGVAGLQIWLKADAGTSTTTDGALLSTWSDQSGNGFDAGLGVSPTYYSTTTNLNFNPIIDFDGSNQYLENLNNGAYTQSYFYVIVPDNQVDGTLSGQVPFGFDCNSGVLNTGTCGLTFAGGVLGAFTVAINDEVITHAIGSSTRWRSAQIGTASYSANKPMLVHYNENASGTGTEIFEKGSQKDNYNVNTYQTISTADYRIGMSSDTNYPFPYDGKIAEIINYSSRTSPIDKQKIESYLSLKYGMTLDSGTQNYIASDGTTNMWSTSTAGTYIFDIFGIGRDEKSGLGQIKSKSINNDNVITIEAVSEGTNISPSFVDIDDLEFLSISNNDGGNTWSATDTPTGYFNLNRLWRVQEVGEVGTVTLDFDVGNINFDIPAPSVGTNYYFTYDSNNDNSLADETPQVMTNTTGNIWRISGIDLDTTIEFTISSEASTNNIPTDIILSNNILNENVSTGTTVGTLTTTDADIGDTHTYTFVIGTGDGDNSYFSIDGSTLSINVSPDYEIKQSFSVRIQTDDGNGGQYQKAFTIIINDIGETIVSLIDYENQIDDYKYSLTSGNWTRNTINPNEGLYSYESDNLGLDNTQSCFEITHTFSGTGTLDFNYNVSSAVNSDYLRFYIDNIEQQAWSGTVPWATYTDNAIQSGTHIYKWCYIKDGNGASGTDNSYIDYIIFTNGSTDITPPIISSINYSSGALLPGGNHNIIINYSDSESGIDTISDTITLNKWDGSIWGTDISSTGFDLVSKTITATQATYPTNNLLFGKYRYNFSISDNSSNSSSTGAVFYIDEVELIISTGALDIGGLENGITKFSTGITITVKTVGAGFDVILNKTSPLLNGSIEIIDWNTIEGVGYDQDPYTSTISIINTNEIIATQAGSINVNGNKNTYTYTIKMGALIGEEQAAGNYNSSISFGIDLDY